MAAGGPLSERVAPRLVLAAAVLDLLVLHALAEMIFPSLRPFVQGVLPRDLHGFAQFALFLALVPVLWLLTDVVAGGHSPGRLALGLVMADASGQHLSAPRRVTRFLGKLVSFGLAGLRLGGLARYDRLAGTVWRSPLAPPVLGDYALYFLNGEHRGKGGRLGSIRGFQPDKSVQLGSERNWTHVKLTDPTIAPRHCEIALRNGLPMIRDLGSATGTQVNGKRIAPHVWVSLAGARDFTLGSQQMALRL